MPTLSEEEDNYVRLNMLLTGLSTKAACELFDKEFAPSCLRASFKKEFNKLLKLKKKQVITQAQWNIIDPYKGSPSSQRFDVTLIICLLRHLTPICAPSAGFDYLPQPWEVTHGADLARMKYYRNFLAHLKEAKIDNGYFTQAWNEITDAVGRLGGSFLLQECVELKTKVLDAHRCTIPFAKREVINEEIEKWRESDKMFVVTRSSKYVLDYVKNNSIVTITGSFGVGKSAMLHHVALQMEEFGYEVLPVDNARDIVQFCDSYKKMIFVIDDFCGKTALVNTYFENWKIHVDDIQRLIKDQFTKIIVTCRSQVYNDFNFKILGLFQTCKCDLSSEEFCLTLTDKQSIAELYLKTNAAEIPQYTNNWHQFPLMCKVCHENSDLDIPKFFCNPYSLYENEIKMLFKEDQFCRYSVLALCVIFNNQVEDKLFTEDISKKERKIIKNTHIACNQDSGTSRLFLKDEFDSLIDTFFRKENNAYCTINDEVFNFLLKYFNEKIPLCLIQNAKSSFIKERFRFLNNDDGNHFMVCVQEHYQNSYLQRMIDDWSSGNVENVFSNINMMHTKFREIFLSFLSEQSKSDQNKLACTSDLSTGATPLICCCSIGSLDMVKWCIQQAVDINQCNKIGQSPLFVASQKDYMDVVKNLLDNGADINKYTDTGETLYI